MPTTVIRAVNEGTYTSWIIGGAYSRDTAVDTGDPVAHDDATTYLYTATVAAKNSWRTLGGGGAVIQGSIERVDLNGRFRAGAAGSGTVGIFCRLNGVDGAAYTHVLVPAWETKNSPSTARPGGGLWSVGDFPNNDLNCQLCINCVAYVVNIWVTSLWAEVVWGPPTGGWVSFIVGWLGPVLGGGLLLPDMAKLAADVHLASRGTTRVLPHEYPEMLQGLRADPHRRYCFGS